MSVSEVESIVVLSDELLDAPESLGPTGMQVLWRAMRALTEARTFSFETRTTWPTGCEERWSGGLGRVDFVHYGFSASVYVDDGVQPFYVIDWGFNMETWVNETSGWSLLDLGFWDIWNSTQHHYLDWAHFSPVGVLALLLTRPEPKEVTVVSIEDGRMMLGVRFEPGHEIDRELWPVWDTYTFLLDDGTYEVSEYVLEREQEGCGASKVHATEGQYGIDVEFPDAIRRESTRLSVLESLISQQQ